MLYHTPATPKELRQDKQARKQDQHLPGEGKEYRLARHAYALEESWKSPSGNQ